MPPRLASNNGVRSSMYARRHELPPRALAGLLCDVTVQPDEVSPPWCLRLISELNAADNRAIALAEALTPQQLNWSRRPYEWSVGQCLEHLYITNEVYLGPMSTSLKGRQPVVEVDIGPRYTTLVMYRCSRHWPTLHSYGRRLQ